MLLVITWQMVVGALYVLLLILLVAPAMVFLFHGWNSRRDDILHVFNADVALSYMQSFHSSETPTENGRKAVDWLRQYYGRQFGRRLFVAPLLICLSVGACLLYLCLLTATDWLRNGALAGGILPLEVVLAIAGAYMWVTNDQILRTARANLSPGDLYWESF